jgi:hypothetical protein
MGKSYRIKTDIGVDKNISLQLDQDFEFLEILSLQISQNDIYTKNCADYGVVVGRVVANGGLGIPNVKVSIFVPITETDSLNEEVVAIYPYVNPNDKNDDGYRYNLLPYTPSYPNHAATGTFPTRGDVLKDPLVAQVYDKYYKYTVKTNESGDYMIFGVPLGQQTIFMDLDLSDIGEFSLTPQDLIRLGLATDAQVAGNTFRSSPDLDTLPQIVSFQKTFEVNPFWGDQSLCQVDISRVDFDLRDELNIDIQPTSVFIGSMFSTIDKYRIAAPKNRSNSAPLMTSAGCKPKDNLGNLCELTPGPGQILAVRQTIFQDSLGRPILEQYRLENSGNVIDENGTWMIEVPMNMDYVTTAEDGTRIFSNDPKVGIPTKGRYRFKVKWDQSPSQTEQIKRPYFLIPNVREYGWSTSVSDPIYRPTDPTSSKDLQSSYYFGLDWSGYTEAFSTLVSNEKLQNALNCEDTFYEFSYNKVYTVSSLLDQYKRGLNRGRFIGIKEIDNNDCASTVNKFPVNEGFKNFDTQFFLFSILLQIFQIIFPPLLIAYHFIASIRQLLRIITGVLGVALIVFAGILYVLAGALAIPTFGISVAGIGAAAKPFLISGILLLSSSILISIIKFKSFGLSMITYPECNSCPCGSDGNDDDSSQVGAGLLTPVSSSYYYTEKLVSDGNNFPTDIKFGDDGQYSDANVGSASLAISSTLGTITTNANNLTEFKTTLSDFVRLPDDTTTIGIPKKMFTYSNELPLGARINLFNTRKKYFDGLNKISVSFDSNSNPFSKHFDNTLSVLAITKFEPGTLLTFVSYNKSNDLNFFKPFVPSQNGFNFQESFDDRVGISGTTKLPTGGSMVVNYATTQTTSLSQTYVLSSGSTGTTYSYPMDVEYYQVVTALTVTEYANLVANNTDPNTLSNLILNAEMDVKYDISYGPDGTIPLKFSDYFTGYDDQFVTIIQRGVDPYSPTYVNKYGLGKLFGYQNEDDLIVTGKTRLNIPIQPLTSSEANVQSVQNLGTQNTCFYPSYFFEPGTDYSAFTTTAIGYYSALDSSTDLSEWISPGGNGLLTALNGWFDRPGANNTTGNVKLLTSKDSNKTFNPTGQLNISDRYYDTYEDVSGADFYWMEGSGNNRNNFNCSYLGVVYYPRAVQNPTLLSNKQRNVLRTDRLPSSDGFEGAVVLGEEWYSTSAILQQNTNFQVYITSSGGFEPITGTLEAVGADIVPPDIEDQDAVDNVLDTFTCNTMVPLACYEGEGTNFNVDTNCKTADLVKGGCYRFREGTPITTLGRDLRLFSEWGLRYRFFYALCRGVLSQTFTNNWVNGSLFAIPFQVRTFYKPNNTIDEVLYCKETFYYNDESNNFYIRSSPYSASEGKFIGKFASITTGSVNDLNLLYPTTIIDLGPKSDVYSFTTLDPQNKGFVINQLSPTSAGDQTDLVNLFVISRITSKNFILTNLLSVVGLGGANLAINSLFSRDNFQNLLFPQLRVDGDLAQLMSINSEFGSVKFSPEVYNNSQQTSNPPIYFINTPEQSILGVFFSSTTEDLQYKDFITPGRILFRPNNSTNAIPFVYGLKSQTVPFYRWSLSQPSNLPNIFGSQLNNWSTGTSDIFSWKYQSLDRLKTNQASYFIGSNTQLNDTYARGYIFNVDNNGLNSLTSGTYPDRFLVGAPNHFYFGLINGATALDRFRQKYLADE